jgi:lactoylglutathione lyase
MSAHTTIQISLSLTVLRNSNLDACLAFYGALGLTFQQEQHGSGPIYYSCELGPTVVEIYPGAPGAAPGRKHGGATMLGFAVQSLDAVLDALRLLGVEPTAPPKASAWGRRVLVIDPDGRAIDLSEVTM